MAGRIKRPGSLSILLLVALLLSVIAIAPAGATVEEREQRNAPISIRSDGEFLPGNGVRSGSGTRSDPFVISGWKVSTIEIRDTDKHYVIRDNEIQRLVLDWTGDRATVVENTIGDMRVNQNVKRTGAPTSGLIANNTFGVVGQLRHFDGVFAHNTVGKEAGMEIPFFSNRRAVNFDGFHGSRFFDNVLYGYLEVRLHGHHHGSGYEEGSHYHGPPSAPAHHEGSEAEHADHGETVDHTTRYHQVFVDNNTIYSGGPYALIYTDSNHRGNDRTAASEENPQLNKPHTHFTKVHLVDNKLVGAGLEVNIFNAKDELHTTTNRGLMHIEGNDITLMRDNETLPFERKDGISVWSAVDLALRLIGNKVRYDQAGDPTTADDTFQKDAGIRLQTLDKADVLVARNYITNVHYGIYASNMTETVHWKLIDLVTDGVSEPVAYDSSVKNKPEGP